MAVSRGSLVATIGSFADIAPSCARLAMMQRKVLAGACAVLVALALLSGCARPTYNPSKLKAIKAEAQMLMRAYPVTADVPRTQWPLVIASFQPEFVSIDPAGVHVTTKAYFDGGWGYFVPRNERKLPEPVGRFKEVGQGVYWWRPY